MNYFNKLARQFFLPLLLVLFYSTSSYSAENTATYKPFILADNTKQSLNDATSFVRNKLNKAGFSIVGEYSPYKDTNILIITNDILKNVASQSELGAFGAAVRVSLTQVNDEIQTSFTNPIYTSHVYRMKQDLSDIESQLSSILGNQKAYGPENGLSKADLRDYQYKWLMPHFTDTWDLTSYPSQQAALKAINAILAKRNSGVEKVYQIDIPNKDETVIGVGMTGTHSNDCSGDDYIMSRIDFKKIKSTGHLPYEVVISGGNVFALPAEFRIAINFPDLSMMGDNSFMSIMCAPDAILAALTTAVGGELED